MRCYFVTVSYDQILNIDFKLRVSDLEIGWRIREQVGELFQYSLTLPEEYFNCPGIYSHFNWGAFDLLPVL